jgi:hypothetical protein
MLNVWGTGEVHAETWAWMGDDIRIDIKSFERKWTGLICLMIDTHGWLL